MKKFILVLGLLVSVFLFSSMAMATSIVYMDNTNSWPGYVPYTYDSIGSPKIASITINIDDSTNFLDSIVLNILDRRPLDSLFINANVLPGEPYENWDYYVGSKAVLLPGPSVGYEYTLYDVNPGYVYTTAVHYRPGHPTGIVDDGVGITPDLSGLLASVVYDGTFLTYDFNPGITMGNFTVGYTPDCANDVIITPEPSSLLMLGLGLLGAAGMIRRKKK